LHISMIAVQFHTNTVNIRFAALHYIVEITARYFPFPSKSIVPEEG